LKHGLHDLPAVPGTTNIIEVSQSYIGHVVLKDEVLFRTLGKPTDDMDRGINMQPCTRYHECRAD